MFKSQRSFFQHIKWITLHFQHHTVNHQFHLLKKPRKPQPNYPTLIMPTALGPVSCMFIIYQFLNQTTKMDKWQRIFSKKNISECFRRWNSKVVRFVLLGFVVLVLFYSFRISFCPSSRAPISYRFRLIFTSRKKPQTFWEKHMMWPQFDCLCFRLNFDFAVLE